MSFHRTSRRRVEARRVTQSLPALVDKPDAQERRIRFVCGFIVGAFFGLFSWLSFSQATVYGSLAVTIASGLVVGLAAMCGGDKFWERMFARGSRYFWWWP